MSVGPGTFLALENCLENASLGSEETARCEGACITERARESHTR